MPLKNPLPGERYTNGSETVRVAENLGLNCGLRLDQDPPNGLVYAPWFKSSDELSYFLALGGHVKSRPFELV